MIILTATVQAAQGKEKDLEDILRELVRKTASEKGAVEYRLHKVAGVTGKYRFIEKFKDQAAFDLHSGSDHFKKLGAAMEPFVIENELEMLELLDSIPENQSK
ncbi:putative quinol monooxygenase [Maridesulfovibrio sp.]|uniref:putative quinol monooxygenase n=1 Tax=Maridesulfovibrio sp. TaxID=2795000 RepID=UPI002A18CB76|nr:putative quinol monooxygenase [Maridesulfovibrio sp.]